jgi:ankyrin repeat protein
VEALVAASPFTMAAVNKAGDTFLHSSVAGFRTPGFRRLDGQMELMRYLVRERTADIQKIINLKNDAGLTVLHMAVVGRAHPDLVELLMTTPSIDLNVEDANGMTPLALLRSSASERLIKQIVSAGGVLNSSIMRTRSAIASQIKMQGGLLAVLVLSSRCQMQRYSCSPRSVLQSQAHAPAMARMTLTVPTNT